MKKYIILSVLFTLFGLVSCYDDDSSLGTKNIGDITIGTLEDASIISYSGNKLIREPEIETTYPDDQLTYAWYIYKEDQDKGFRTNKIDSVKNLSYEVNLPAGSYTIIFEATATANGYAATAEMKLAVSTTFSQGFYILKETADGNTELDVYTQNGLVSDLLASTQGEALSGSPRNLSVGYSQAFIDTEENKMVNANTVCITTEQNKLICLRTVDMLKAFIIRIYFSRKWRRTRNPIVWFVVLPVYSISRTRESALLQPVKIVEKWDSRWITGEVNTFRL